MEEKFGQRQKIGWSDALYSLLDFIGQAVSITVRARDGQGVTGVAATGFLERAEGLIREEDDTAEEVVALILDDGGGAYLRRAEFDHAQWEGSELRIDFIKLTIW